jgi:hypothetical protein
MTEKTLYSFYSEAQNTKGHGQATDINRAHEFFNSDSTHGFGLFQLVVRNDYSSFDLLLVELVGLGGGVGRGCALRGLTAGSLL